MAPLRGNFGGRTSNSPGSVGKSWEGFRARASRPVSPRVVGPSRGQPFGNGSSGSASFALNIPPGSAFRPRKTRGRSQPQFRQPDSACQMLGVVGSARARRGAVEAVVLSILRTTRRSCCRRPATPELGRRVPRQRLCGNFLLSAAVGVSAEHGPAGGGQVCQGQPHFAAQCQSPTRTANTATLRSTSTGAQNRPAEDVA
jgi:hypothetical protein